MSDVRKSVRDALLFAAGLFALTFLGGLDPHSIQANTIESVTAAAWAGADAVIAHGWLYSCRCSCVPSGRARKTQGATQ
jgi:hypothetical protein